MFRILKRIRDFIQTRKDAQLYQMRFTFIGENAILLSKLLLFEHTLNKKKKTPSFWYSVINKISAVKIYDIQYW